ncbi:MAG: hypothetical protein JST82_13930 [Bacteroidetes bacterium]|nr:hypothetical protein [Bacteroidota bacterium]
MTTAEKIIKPTKAKVFRTIFLYTGQGESTLMVIPTGDGKDDYIYVLLDSDLDKEPNEIDLVAMFKDLFKNSGELSTFINTHPHKDHMGGIKTIYDDIGFKELWHSNHTPGGEHDSAYKDFKYVLKKVGKENEYHLLATKKKNTIDKTDGTAITKKLGLIEYQVLSPAEYLCDEIDEADANERNNRIHEQCGVMKFTYGSTAKSIIITGDSDKCAWKDHITETHKADLPADVLSASHHGSRSFFKTSEDDNDVYEDHIEEISPDYVIISAPKQKDSPHDHPHDDAMKLYKKHVKDEENVLHLGSKPYSVIVDIDDKGNIDVTTDAELIEAYGNKDDDKGDSGKSDNNNRADIVNRTTRIDKQPMGYDGTLV